jgi:hypothetical protein
MILAFALAAVVGERERRGKQSGAEQGQQYGDSFI